MKSRNALTPSTPNSQIYEDSIILRELFISYRRKIESDASSSSSLSSFSAAARAASTIASTADSTDDSDTENSDSDTPAPECTPGPECTPSLISLAAAAAKPDDSANAIVAKMTNTIRRQCSNDSGTTDEDSKPELKFSVANLATSSTAVKSRQPSIPPPQREPQPQPQQQQQQQQSSALKPMSGLPPPPPPAPQQVIGLQARMMPPAPPNMKIPVPQMNVTVPPLAAPQDLSRPPPAVYHNSDMPEGWLYVI